MLAREGIRQNAKPPSPSQHIPRHSWARSGWLDLPLTGEKCWAQKVCFKHEDCFHAWDHGFMVLLWTAGALPEGKWCMSFTSGWRAKLCLLVWFWDSPFWLRSLLEHRHWQVLFCFLLHYSGHRAVNKPQAFWGSSQSTSASSSQWGSVGVTENQVTKKLNSH